MSNPSDAGLPANAYQMDKRMDAVRKFLALGSMKYASEITGIPLNTLRRWKDEPWWDEAIAEIRRTSDAKLDVKLSSIIERALAVVEDRLEHGDVILNNKTGKLERKPVGLRDTAKVATEILARQQQLRKTQDDVKVQKQTVQETLSVIAQEFAKLSRKDSTKTAETIEYQEIPKET